MGNFTCAGSSERNGWKTEGATFRWSLVDKRIRKIEADPGAREQGISSVG